MSAPAVLAGILFSLLAPFQQRPPDFDRQLQQQADTDATWRAASDGFMQMDKITYRSKVGDLDIPAFVFQPLKLRGAKGHPAIVWVHENIRGHLYEHYIPYIREATAKGYIVIAPEYRGSIGYGEAFYDAIDYGGREVDDVVTAADVLRSKYRQGALGRGRGTVRRSKYRQVDPGRIGIIGWSHGGLITLLSIFRNPGAFDAAAAIVPVTNLLERLDRKGVEKQRALIDPANRFGGSPAERPQVYRDRSPLFHVDRLRIPLLVHVARNDEDVNIEEDMPLVEALRAEKPQLAVTKVYDHPAGGHTFDRRINMRTWEPENNPEQRDSWTRVWRFLERSLGNPIAAN